MDDRRHQGRVAVVTGAGSGIGRAVTARLAAEGAHVMINGFGDAAAIETERAALEGRPDRLALALVIFSAKECVYKAQYPLTGLLLDFQQVEVTLDLLSGGFVGVLSEDVPLAPADRVMAGDLAGAARTAGSAVRDQMTALLAGSYTGALHTVLWTVALAIVVGWTVTGLLMAVVIGIVFVPVMILVTLAPFVQAAYEAYRAYQDRRRRATREPS